MPRRKYMHYYIYILQSSKDHKFYAGLTNNLKRRFREYNAGKTFSTKSRVPFKLIFYEVCLNKGDAKQREKYFKTGIGKRFIKSRLTNYLKGLKS